MKQIIATLVLLISLPSMADVFFAGDDVNFIKTDSSSKHIKLSHCRATSETSASCERLVKVEKSQFLGMKACLSGKMAVRTAQTTLSGFLSFAFALGIPQSGGLMALPMTLTVASTANGVKGVSKAAKQFSVYSSDTANDRDYITSIMDSEEFISLLKDSLYKTMDCDVHGAWEETTGLFGFNMSRAQINNLKMALKN